MPQYNHAFPKFDKELMARAVGRDMAISNKQAIRDCNYLRRRKLAQAKRLLEGVLEKKQAIPFKRFTDGLGHRAGKLAAGRYPIKASRAILKLLESAEANAQTKGLNTGELEIIHLCANKAHSPVHYGRHSGREFKRTHVEVVLQETTKKDEKKTKKAAEKKEEKPEVKKESPAPKPAAKPEVKAVPDQKPEPLPDSGESASLPGKPGSKKEEPKEKEPPKAEVKEDPEDKK